MLKVGITGGIGSGKSVVCSFMARTFNVPVYFSDDEARLLMETDAKLVHDVKAAFGPETYIGSKLNRPYLGSIVFKDKAKLEQLNAIVHPAVQADLDGWFKVQEHKGVPYAIVESAIMFESGLAEKLDRVILIVADYAVRSNRVMYRDKCTWDEAETKIRAQMGQDEKMKLVPKEYIVDNTSNRTIDRTTTVGAKIESLDTEFRGHRFLGEQLDPQWDF